MRIHLYDFLNKNKKAILRGEDFSGVSISHNIDDFSSCSLQFTITESLVNTPVQGFDNIYVEDDNGDIIFGGIITGYQVTPNGGSFTCFDHRWVLTRLVLDEAITLASSDNVLDKVEELLAAAKAKRQIPLEFDRDGSAINDDFRADLKFEIGDDIGSSLQKIIQTIYARWAVRYFKDGNVIYGKLVVRSVRGVSPEGVGISRSWAQSEDGEVINMFYGEGDNRSNIQDFQFVFDLQNYTSRSKVGVKIGDESQFFQAEPDPTSAVFEFYFGRAENFATDYKINSQDTALVFSRINQTYPRQDIDCTVMPTFTRRLNCGDRVSLEIKSPLLTVAKNQITARIDSVQYTYRDGYFERRIFLNTMSPQKRTGTTGLLQTISAIQQRLEGLDQNYFNSPSS